MKTLKNVKLFTHNDLDGIGCEILGRLAFPNNIDVTITKNPQDASQKVADFIRKGEYELYNAIFITDISVSEEVADLIDEHCWNITQLLDHHGTAYYLNNRHWATVRTNHPTKDQLESGTNMFYEFLIKHNFLPTNHISSDAVKVFVEKVRRYDCWEWKTKYNDLEALNLNTLFFLLGRDRFVSRYLLKFDSLDRFSIREGEWLEMFDEVDRTILKVDGDKKTSYIDRKEKQMQICDFNDNTVGVVFAEQYISELGNVLSERNPQLDYIMMVDMGGKKVSLRTIHDYMDLGIVAKQFGGGGHSKASGFMFDSYTSKTVIDLLLEPKGLKAKLLKLIDKLF